MRTRKPGCLSVPKCWKQHSHLVVVANFSSSFEPLEASQVSVKQSVKLTVRQSLTSNIVVDDVLSFLRVISADLLPQQLSD